MTYYRYVIFMNKYPALTFKGKHMINAKHLKQFMGTMLLAARHGFHYSGKYNLFVRICRTSDEEIFRVEILPTDPAIVRGRLGGKRGLKGRSMPDIPHLVYWENEDGPDAVLDSVSHVLQREFTCYTSLRINGEGVVIPNT